MIDPIASTALGKHIDPVYMAFIDFATDPQRVNTSDENKTFTGTGFVDVDGFEFNGLDSGVMDIGPVNNSETGSQELNITLSGLTELDDDMLTEVYTRANWQGRIVKLWRIIYDTTGTQKGGLQHYYTGRVTKISLPTSPKFMTIEATIEGYLASFSPASNGTYQSQSDYDPGDFSGRAAVAVANNNRSGSVGGVIPALRQSGFFGNVQR
jgi:hypothetical protein